jgi:proline iminopeptidase
MRDLYPSSEPYAVHKVAVAQQHRIYVEECGNSQGCPVVFLHGGPGSGCSSDHHRYFDPAFYRIVLVDQRGAGRSLPSGETEYNRTQDLVSDMEAIRRQLGIEQWLLFGGSWGATLALIYSLTHPGRVTGMILRGAFLARESDLAWFFIGLKKLLPQAWYRLVEGLPDNITLTDLINRYHDAVHGGDRSTALQAASKWSSWCSQVVNWHKAGTDDASEDKLDTEQQQTRLLAKVSIETHYAHHRYFVEENEILRRIGSLCSMPVSIVHGRYDLTCTMESAWQLHRAIPDSRLIQLPDAGHLIEEPSMVSALIKETDRMRDLF